MDITQLIKLKPFVWFSDIDSKTLFQIIGSLNDDALDALLINSSRLRRPPLLPLMLQQAMLTMNLPVMIYGKYIYFRAI